MKEMEYSAERKIEVLDTGYCLGFLYYILNLGTHPTAYIKIPENHKYYKKEYDEIELNVHWGATYSRDYLYINQNQKIEGWFIGWDYSHCDDYAGYELKLPKQLRTNGKKWTTEEIFREVKDACYQLTNIED